MDSADVGLFSRVLFAGEEKMDFWSEVNAAVEIKRFLGKYNNSIYI